MPAGETFGFSSFKPLHDGLGEFMLDLATVDHQAYPEANAQPTCPATASFPKMATLPNIIATQWTNGQVNIQANYTAGLQYSLLRASRLSPPDWSAIAALLSTNGAIISLIDAGPPAGDAFYRVQAAKGD